MRRVLVALAVFAAGCGTVDVHTESAVEQPAASTSPTTTPSTTSTPTPTQPPDAEPNEPAPTAPPAPAQGVESIGDSLFPDLGTDELDVQSYDVRLGYDPSTEVIDADVTITALFDGRRDRLVLDAGEMDIETVSVDGSPAEFTLGDDELVIHPSTLLPVQQPITIDIAYSDVAGGADSPVGLGIGWFATPTGSFVLNEPDGAHSWLPSNDHPSDKATWRFELTVPSGVSAVANGELVEQRASPDGDTWVWEQREPMATYLVQVLTGDYAVLDHGVAGTVSIVDVALTDDVDQMQPYFDLTDDQLAFFEPLFGPYPLDRYGLAFTESFSGLAMETQGRSLFSRDDFPGGSPGAVEHLLLSHELAHQWFGNAVTPADWSDLWLNESFATYAQWMWLDHAGLLPLDLQARSNLAYRQDFDESTGEPSVENLFGFERYDGGAVVLHALRQEIGDESFFTLLQRWVAENDGTSKRTADFTALAAEVAGRDLTAFFDTWLFAEDVPDEYP